MTAKQIVINRFQSLVEKAFSLGVLTESGRKNILAHLNKYHNQLFYEDLCTWLTSQISEKERTDAREKYLSTSEGRSHMTDLNNQKESIYKEFDELKNNMKEKITEYFSEKTGGKIKVNNICTDRIVITHTDINSNLGELELSWTDFYDKMYFKNEINDIEFSLETNVGGWGTFSICGDSNQAIYYRMLAYVLDNAKEITKFLEPIATEIVNANFEMRAKTKKLNEELKNLGMTA